jgi:hypothetical protein
MDKSWDYEVAVKELQVADPEGHVLRNRLATVDVGSGEILGLVSPRYSVVQNRTLHSALDEVKDDLGITLQKVLVVKDKRATLFRYTFGEDKMKTVEHSSQTEDKVKFGFEVINSFDSQLGSGHFRAWAERLVCTNGLTVPKEVGRINFKDFGEISGRCIRDTMLPKIAPILETVGIWNRWAQVIPSRTKVGEFVSSHFGPKRSGIFLDGYDKLSDKSIWGLYNLITAHISHEAKSRVASDLRWKQIDLEKVISKLYKISLN